MSYFKYDLAENPVVKLYGRNPREITRCLEWIADQPGESLKPHFTPVNVFFFILEGAVDVLVGDETITVKKDNLVESPKDIAHCLANTSTENARILVVKSPKPTAKAKLL